MNESEFLEQHAARTATFGLMTFTPLIGETFVCRDASGASHALYLSSVEEDHRGSDLFENFTLVFTAARDIYLNQGYYLLEHGAHGEFPLCLVPTFSMSPDRNTYCTYFSLRRQPA